MISQLILLKEDFLIVYLLTFSISYESIEKHNLTIATRIDETSKAKSKYFSPPKKPQKQLQKEEEIPHKMLEAKVPNVLKNGQSYINTLKDTPSVLLRKVKEIIPSVILESEEESMIIAFCIENVAIYYMLEYNV